MEYRDFMDLTNEEIKFIVNEIFHPKKITNIKKSKKWNRFTCDITTGGWDDGETKDFEVTDELELEMPNGRSNGIHIDFSINAEDTTKWKQYLLAKGCNELLKDNPYFVKAE